MTLTIDLAPELESRLIHEAAKHGLDAGEFVLQIIERQLPGEAGTGKKRLKGYGKYAHVPFSTDDLHAERQQEKLREESRAQERRG